MSCVCVCVMKIPSGRSKQVRLFVLKPDPFWVVWRSRGRGGQLIPNCENKVEEDIKISEQR